MIPDCDIFTSAHLFPYLSSSLGVCEEAGLWTQSGNGLLNALIIYAVRD